MSLAWLSKRAEQYGRGVVPRSRPSLRAERRLFAAGFSVVGGVDEVGRGAWAGPVSVGIAVLRAGARRRLPSGLRDSKQLTHEEREALYGPLGSSLAAYAVGHASPEECDGLGMTAAQRLAARRAFERLDVLPEVMLLDGTFDFLGSGPESSSCTFPPVRTIVRGDASSKVIAAASVLAKVTRDRLMELESEHYPWYGFDRNRGYPTPVHKMALAAWGLTPFHRRSWAFVEALGYRPSGWLSLGAGGLESPGPPEPLPGPPSPGPPTPDPPIPGPPEPLPDPVPA
ncbi:MAG: ribonuclease HII [Acidimicrobiales bacterium]